MKRTVFIQQIPHYPTPWGDAVASWNLASFMKGMGTWVARAYRQRLKFWSRQNFNIILDIEKDNPNTLLLKHFIIPTTASGEEMVKRIDMEAAIKYLDENPFNRSIAYGVFFDPNHRDFSTDYIIKNSKWFARPASRSIIQQDEEMEEEVNTPIVGVDTFQPIDKEASGLNCLVWFFVYRAVDLPIYYIIPNPDMLGTTMNFNDVNTDDIRYMAVEPHFGTIGDLIFRPTFSNNVLKMTPGKIVAGEEFDILPFEGGVFGWGFKETVPKVPIKVFSDLEFQRDSDTNTIHFKFNPNQQSGYIHIRWNSNSVMDLAQSSRSMDDIQNKCHITLDVHRNDRYKYQEGDIKWA